MSINTYISRVVQYPDELAEQCAIPNYHKPLHANLASHDSSTSLDQPNLTPQDTFPTRT